MFRLILGAILCSLLITSESSASSFGFDTTGNGGTLLYVTGDFTASNFVPGEIGIEIVGGGAPIPGPAYNQYGGPYYGYDLMVTANQIGKVEACAYSQIGSMCERSIQSSPTFEIFQQSSTLGTISIGVSNIAFNTTPLDLEIFLSVPDGFTISETPPVPEPSTWVMILLGFAGLSAAACRRRRLSAFVVKIIFCRRTLGEKATCAVVLPPSPEGNCKWV